MVTVGKRNKKLYIDILYIRELPQASACCQGVQGNSYYLLTYNESWRATNMSPAVSFLISPRYYLPQVFHTLVFTQDWQVLSRQCQVADETC